MVVFVLLTSQSGTGKNFSHHPSSCRTTSRYSVNTRDQKKEVKNKSEPGVTAGLLSSQHCQQQSNGVPVRIFHRIKKVITRVYKRKREKKINVFTESKRKSLFVRQSARVNIIIN